jgi:hypothetical protein
MPLFEIPNELDFEATASPQEAQPEPVFDILDDLIPAAPAPAVNSPTGRTVGPNGVPESHAIAKGESSAAVDYVALAAGGIFGGQSPDAVETQLVQQGMDQTAARRMVQFMSAVRQKRLQELKKKGNVWVRMLGGLVLIALALTVGWISSDSDHARVCGYLATVTAMIGIYLLFSGLWRLGVGPRRLRAKELAVAWRKQ